MLQWLISINASDEISGVNAVQFDIANFIDTEPPYEVIWWGCMWLHNIKSIIFRILFGVIGWPYDTWDNAGNHISQPHTINVVTSNNS